jgi:hypothetical protein
MFNPTFLIINDNCGGIGGLCARTNFCPLSNVGQLESSNRHANE